MAHRPSTSRPKSDEGDDAPGDHADVPEITTLRGVVRTEFQARTTMHTLFSMGNCCNLNFAFESTKCMPTAATRIVCSLHNQCEHVYEVNTFERPQNKSFLEKALVPWI